MLLGERGIGVGGRAAATVGVVHLHRLLAGSLVAASDFSAVGLGLIRALAR
ncbi:MAG TPA: hypothetical protein VNI34_09375 [Candidatus Nitrosotalea sp.]|nr:hypothetical protein [Candidatus Nitrosotalea sp.]